MKKFYCIILMIFGGLMMLTGFLIDYKIIGDWTKTTFNPAQIQGIVGLAIFIIGMGGLPKKTKQQKVGSV